ncbi:helix-turn-helix domain-containing protein [Agrobacterium sp. Azo12]|uniref:helix-turn-helix domain-containing protein n=1 Tax=Agrobacterium sp. Azo12 TaxID=3031129 RepID=UPI0023D89AAE|nr:helix-turn-helix domain-containing protein [Agrobacterium sp. Azo12]MDO5897211.1 helix-turn-helix domain-containing protein [Agrobacterium sp. Azo12]
MYFDRLDGDELRVTHDALAFVLDVRRSTIIDALHILEGEGMITCKRGSIVLRNRPDLIKLSGPLYGLAEAEYQRLLGANFRLAESC